MNRNINTGLGNAQQQRHLRDQVKVAPSVTTDESRSLYVIECSGGYTCLGFANAQAHAAHIATLLGQPALAFGEADFGQLTGYAKYQAATNAWCTSPMAARTYFDPGTPDEVIAVFERYRRNDGVLRVFYGDRATGRDWCEELATCGRVGRSMGPMRVPLLIEDGEHAGPHALTASIVRLIDWKSERELYRHATYHQPDMALASTDSAEYPWAVTFDGATQAQFGSQGRAAAYLAFMRGASVSRKSFQ